MCAHHYGMLAALQFTVGIQVKQAKDLLFGAHDRQRTLANESRRELLLSPGDQVWLNPKHLNIKTPGTRKLLPRFVGLYEVLERVGEVAYRLKLPEKMRIHNVFHVSLLKPVKTDGRYPSGDAAVELDTTFGYVVEMVLSHRTRQSRGKNAGTITSYLVKYKDLGPEHNAWVSEKGLQRDYPNLLSAYWAERSQ